MLAELLLVLLTGIAYWLLKVYRAQQHWHQLGIEVMM